MSYPASSSEQELPRPMTAVQVLIGICVAMLFLQTEVVLKLDTVLAFDPTGLPDHWWTAFTYMFAHVALWHLIANMYCLYLFGPRLEQAWGYRKFTWFYVLCGLGGVAFQMLFIRSGLLLGASAAVFGVMTAYVMQWPDDEIYLLFVLPIRVRTLAVALIVFNLVMGIMATTNGTNITYFAHLGGVIAAYLYMRMSVSPGIEQVRQRVAELPDADEPPRAIPRNLPRRERVDEVDDIVAKSKAIASKRTTSAPQPAAQRSAKADELDRVLDKISRQGLESLSKDERKILEEMSKRLRDQ